MGGTGKMEKALAEPQSCLTAANLPILPIPPILPF
jgi:hypothetical protein